MKRIVSTILVVILIIGLMTGCNDNEISMYKLSNEVSLLNAMKQEGHIEYTFNFESLLDPYSESYEKDKAMYDLVQEQIKALNLDKIYYSSSVDQNKNMLNTKYYIKDKNSKAIDLFDILLIEETFYVNYDGLADLALPYLMMVEDNDSKLLQFFEAADGYIQFSFEDMVDPSNTASPFAASSMQLQNGYNLKERHAFLQDLQADLDTFMLETMKDFTTSKVEKEYNSSLKSDMYTYTFKSDDIVDVGLSFVKYILDNFTEVKAFYFTLLENDNFLEYYGMTTETDKEMFVAQMKEAFDTIEENMEEAQMMIDEQIATEAETGELKTTLKGFLGESYLTYGLGKNSSDKYLQTVDLHVDFSSPFDPSSAMTMDFKTESNVTKKSSVSVTAPTEFVTFETFNNKFPDTLALGVDYGDYTYSTGLVGSDYGYADAFIRNGRSYIGLSSVPGKMIHAIKWSEADQKPYYVLPDASGTGFVEDFFLENGEIYVAIAEYRNPGYEVTWDDYSRVITIKTK